MEFVSILDLEESPFKEAPRGATYQDLNLDQIFKRIENIWGDKVEKYYYYLPANKECTQYRSEVSKDVFCEEMYEILQRFLEAYKECSEVSQKRKKVRMADQQYVFLIKEINLYCDLLEKLFEELKSRDLKSRGFKLLIEYLKNYLESGDYKTMRSKAKELKEKFDSIRLTVMLENNQVFVKVESAKQEEVEGNEKDSAKDGTQDSAGESQKTRERMPSPFLDRVDLTVFEQEVTKIFLSKRMDLLRLSKDFFKSYEGYAKEAIERFAQEIPYYLSYYAFMKKMKEAGYPFAHPVMDDKVPMQGRGVYDLALACANLYQDKEVIRNDFSYQAGKTFFVLTGPNQGGKTTFARCLGQLVFFTRMGLMIPGESGTIPYFHWILTHFSVEESVETGRGKLKEELIRLAPMMEQEYENAFVILNELFTTAANYDAIIMGKNVLNRFIDANCKGIYVTHLKELGEAHESVQSIHATLDEARKQTYKIVDGEALEFAYAQNQVEKHRLTYQQLKERLV